MVTPISCSLSLYKAHGQEHTPLPDMVHLGFYALLVTF